jgi:transaldolase
MKSKMQLTTDAGTEFWNDSCSIPELTEAVAEGAVGAASSPLIVNSVVRKEFVQWREPLDRIILDHPSDTEDEIAWKLIETVGLRAAKILLPAFEQTAGMKGRLSLQVNPKFYRNPERMLEHATTLSALTPNVSVELPSTEAGLVAMEEATAGGICVNASVAFTLSQAIAAAESIERGFARRKTKRADFIPFVTLMVGTLDDQLKRVAPSTSGAIDPAASKWAGVAVFKKAYGVFKSRGYRAKLVSGSYGNPRHWSEFIGGNVIVSLPYDWWKKFNSGDVEVRNRIYDPVDPMIVRGLYDVFPDFRAAFDEGGLKRAEFDHFGATVHTLNMLLGGYQSLLEFVRARMLR